MKRQLEASGDLVTLEKDLRAIDEQQNRLRLAVEEYRDDLPMIDAECCSAHVYVGLLSRANGICSLQEQIKLYREENLLETFFFKTACHGDRLDLKTLLRVEGCRLLQIRYKTLKHIGISSCANQTCLHFAASRGNLQSVRLILDEIASCLSKPSDLKAFVDTRNDRGTTALMLAALHGHWETVALLCDGTEACKNLVGPRLADLDVVNVFNQSALRLATRNSRLKAAEELLVRGAAQQGAMQSANDIHNDERRYQMISLLEKYTANS